MSGSIAEKLSKLSLDQLILIGQWLDKNLSSRAKKELLELL